MNMQNIFIEKNDYIIIHICLMIGMFFYPGRISLKKGYGL